MANENHPASTGTQEAPPHEGKAPADEAEALHTQVSELTALLQRLQADFENYKKRVAKEQEAAGVEANRRLLADLLPFLDHFRLALQSSRTYAEKDAMFRDTYQGMELMLQELEKTLEKHGLTPIDALGKPFSPHEHEVLRSEESGEEQGIVLEEYQKGYRLADQVLRHAKVKVSKGPAEGRGQEEDKDLS